MHKFLLSALLYLTVSLLTTVNAQITFNKKSGEFSSGSTVVAKLTDEKVKQLGGKNYSIMDASGQNELLSYSINRWQDTLGGPYHYWYTVACKPLGLTANRASFSSMNTFKEIGQLVIDSNLLQANGAINESAMKAYFTNLHATYPDYIQQFNAIDDSLVKLISINAVPAERDMRKDVIANEYGKIGQGNTVIGYWEYSEPKDDRVVDNKDHLFTIKNLNGGIVCVSWIELSGAHTYAFKDGQRSAESWTVPDFVHNNPIQNKLGYVSMLSQYLIKAGLL